MTDLTAREALPPAEAYHPAGSCDACSTPPDLDALKAPEAIDLDPVLGAWITYARRKTEEIARLTSERDRAYEVIKAALGDAPEGRLAGRPVVRWAWSRPSTYIDKRALERDLPDVAARYTREKAAARPFRLLDPDEASQ
jgi:hypothetical protein